ncbi:anthranilate synthase component I [Thermococcus stetteri]|uniref:anthranilate synthase component I n=1 Tax=Thermococcus stetteri TaxID=49900 RepID=UPI001AE43122|nr:anthranilate synthase component I [Thermococcus stetteri]MBP1912811.1 anthranilate synthase component 1 [Thermococcus stetteri]
MPIKELKPVDPLRLYSVLREQEIPFMLRSAEKDSRKARFTYLSAEPEFVVEVGEGTRVDGERISGERNPFMALKGLMKEKIEGRGFMGGFVGYIAYDSVHSLIGGNIGEPSVFGYYPWTFVYDHSNGKLSFFYVREPPFEPELMVDRARREELPPEDSGSEVISTDASEEEFREMVETGKEYIRSGDVFQVVLSREYTVRTELDPLEVYRRLVELNPSPYSFILEFKKTVVGASPETMGSVEGRIFRINPIAGTAPRGSSEEEDRELEKALLSDEKERAEHIMLVDLARNDVRRVSKSGSVKLVRFFDVLKYSHVQHIESEVIGELDEEKDAFDAMEAAFPAGTLTGAPKIRAMEIIDELERSRRRVYGGAVGYFSLTGDADMAIAIRMAEIEGRKASVRAGAGIVADSVPEKEFFETENKMRAVLKALGVEG